MALLPTRRRAIALPWIAIVLYLAAQPAAYGADWPQWRGLNRDGVSTESIEIWREPPPVIWTAAVGEAHSAPVVVGDRLVSMSKEGDNEVVFCLDSTSGKEVWRHSYSAPFSNSFGSGPRSTPMILGDRIISLGATGDLYCFQLADGKVLWNVNVLKKYDATNLFFGTSASPLLVGDNLLIMVGGKGAGIVAFDLATGEERWKSQDDRASYASPILYDGKSSAQAIFLTQQGLLSLNGKDGQALWRLPLVTFNDENACTPVVFRDLVIATSVSYGGVGMRVEGSQATLAWQSKAFSSYFSSPVILGNELYAVTGTPAALKCLDATNGKELWLHSSIGLLYASLLVANDRLLIQTDTGLLFLAEPSRAGYKQVAKAQACGPGWIQPALANGLLFVRDKSHIKAIKVGK